MRDFSGGVTHYTKATVEIGFPEGDVVCHWCPLMVGDYKHDRQRCARTGEFLVDPKHSIGYYCPLKFEE